MRIYFGAALLLAVIFTDRVPAEDWPQFRGINASGVSRDSDNLPVKFSHEERVHWSVDLGKGIACPVVSRGRVCVTSMVDKTTFAVFCLDAATGKEIWRQEFATGENPSIMPAEHSCFFDAGSRRRAILCLLRHSGVDGVRQS